MMFVLTTLNGGGDRQKFSFRLNTLEAGLDFISSLAARKETILSVYVVDKDSLTPLPADAFDGSLLSTGIGQLQAQWKQLLTKPPSKLTDPWIQARIDQNTQSIVQHELLITSVRQLIEQLAHLRIPKAYKHTLTQRYQSILVTYERQLTRTYALRKRLNRLEQAANR
jgi:hypothetical protein